MSVDLPVWATTKTILLYCWRERALALRYALVPIVLVILLDVGGAVAGIDIGDDRLWVVVESVVALLAYAPFLVTWYQTVAGGEAQARSRPLFTFGAREAAVVMTSVLVALIVVLAALGLIGMVGIVSAAVSVVNAFAAQVVAVLLVIPAAFVGVMVLTRLTVVVAFAAAGRHLRLRDGWRLTAPVAVPITLIHVILGAIGLGVLGIAIALASGIMETAGFGGENGSAALDLAVSIADTIFGMVYLLLSTTLFGIIYRRLADG